MYIPVKLKEQRDAYNEF